MKPERIKLIANLILLIVMIWVAIETHKQRVELENALKIQTKEYEKYNLQKQKETERNLKQIHQLDSLIYENTTHRAH